MGAASDRPDATFVALAGDEVVGYAKFHLSSARPGVAVHDLTGVKRSWRGRGIARALKAAQIAWAMREGYERLETANELRNAPIRKLNTEFGYRPIPGRALLRGPLAPKSLMPELASQGAIAPAGGSVVSRRRARDVRATRETSRRGPWGEPRAPPR